MKKTLYFILLIICVALCGCGSSKEKTSLRVGIMPDLDSVPLIIAQERGFFKEENVTVDIKSFKSAMDRDAALQSGNLEGTISDILAAAFAKNGGFDVKITSCSDGAYNLVTSDPEIGSIDALKNKDVAVSRNTIIEYVTDRMLEKAGLSPDVINKVVIPQIPARLEMLQNGKLPAATLPEPMASVAVKGGCRTISGSNVLGINPGIILFTGKSCKEKAKEIKAFYRAYNKAVRYLNTAKREEYIDLVITKAGFPKNAGEVLVLPKYNEAVHPDRKEVNACVDWLLQKSLIKKRYMYEDLVNQNLLP